MYGTVVDVASKSSVWSHGGNFYDPEDPDYAPGTNPTATTVSGWLEQLSAQMDIALGTHWFDTPIAEDTAAYKAIAGYICGLAADLVQRANGVEVEVSPQGKILQDMGKWVKENADGLKAGGATQQTPSPALKSQARFTVIGW